VRQLFIKMNKNKMTITAVSANKIRYKPTFALQFH